MTRSGSGDVFTLALGAALVLHAAVILMVNFDVLRDRVRPVPSSLDVILVQWESEEPPEEADFLAQATQRGGGETPERLRPADPFADFDLPQPEPETGQETVEETPRAVDDARVLTADNAPLVVDTLEEIPAEPEPQPTADQLIRDSRAMARLTREPAFEPQPLPEHPRRKFVSANTQEHLYAGYMRAWVAKVERVGNLNYPEEARRARLDGSLVLSVDVDQDGSVLSIQVLRSSGHEILDEAAVRIVRLAAPFAPLPEEIAREADILTITRTWQFSARRGLQ